MADIQKNPTIHRKRLEVRKREMEINLDKMDLRKMEIEEEIARIEENKAATLAEIQNLASQIASAN